MGTSGESKILEFEGTKMGRWFTGQMGGAESPNKNKSDGQWHGPFEPKEDAVRVAHELGRKMAKDCLRCRP